MYKAKHQIVIILNLSMVYLLQLQSPTLADNDWRVLPIRSEYEYNNSITGGEAMQLPHGIARSESNPDYIYWNHDGAGPWVSTNGGESWKKCVAKGLYQDTATSVAVDPVNPLRVFALQSQLWYSQDKEFDGLYRSVDGGDNWELVLAKNVGTDWSKHRYIARNIAFDRSTMGSTQTDTVYTALFYRSDYPTWDPNDGGLYKSTDGGDNWTQLVKSTIDKYYQIAVGGSNVYLATDDGLKVYTTGDSYSALGDLPAGAVTSVFAHPSDPNIVFATVYNDGLYKSTNSGINFAKIKDFDVWSGFYNPGYPDTIYLVGIWKGTSTAVTHDGGATWAVNTDCTSIPQGIYSTRIYGVQAGVVSNAKNPDDAVAFANANIYKTTNAGVTFLESAALFTGYAPVFQGSYAFDQYDPNRFAIGLADVGYVVTNNGGDWFWKNWNTSDGGIVPDWATEKKLPNANTIYCPCIDFRPVQSSEFMAATVGYSPVNAGKTRRMYLESEATGWALETSYEPNLPPDGYDPYPWDYYLQYHRTDPCIVYTSQSKSTDGGISYTDINFAPYTTYNYLGDYAKIYGQCYAHPNVVYATYQFNQVVLRSDDEGATWSKITQPGWKLNDLTNFATIAIDPCNPYLFYSIDANKDIAKCEKVGESWNWTTLGLLPNVERPDTKHANVSNISIDPRYPDIIYASVKGSGISPFWRTTDGGSTWIDISGNLPRTGSYVIAVSPHTGEVFAGGLCGTYVFPPPYQSTNLFYEKSSLLSNSDSVNHAPALASIGNKSVNENALLNFTVSATDADSDTITYSATGLPTGAIFSSQNFSWTPGYTQAGTYQVTFTASDGTASGSETITITVNNTNRAPVLVAVGNKSVNENSLLSFSISATDADSDIIIYSATGLPTGAVFSGQTFTWTPGYSQAGTYQVTFTASDGQDQDSETVTITVDNVNRAPALSAIGNKSVYVGDSVSFTVEATDPDSDTIEYSVNGLPSGATFASQSFVWTPGQSQAGSFGVTFTASDGQLEDSDAITITVSDADTSAPTVTNCSPASGSIQIPTNNLIILHITDAGKGVDANSVIIKVNNDIVYTGNTAH